MFFPAMPKVLKLDWNKYVSQGQSSSTAGRPFALRAPGLGSIPGLPYHPLWRTRRNP